MPDFTPQQQAAIATGGNLLVVAGAGTGKTRTLVERCLRLILDPARPVSLDAVLLVTFTEAAAGEMRRRIRQRLEQELQANPERPWLAEQLALVDTAWICTLHSFCLRLAREHFHELALDPEFTVLDETQREILAAETLAQVMERRYAGTQPADLAIQDFVLAHANGGDQAIRQLVLRIHDYLLTLPDPEGWLASQAALFGTSQPGAWREWLAGGVASWRAEWTEALEELAPANPMAAQCHRVLGAPGDANRGDPMDCVLEGLLAVRDGWPRGKKGGLLKPIEALFEEAEFLLGVLNPPAADARSALRPDAGEGAVPNRDPLVEDWDWVRPHMLALLDLVRGFAEAFAAAKREGGVADFHDLEQFALRLLWDRAAARPSALADAMRQQLHAVFVDEYQDINAAQDLIVAALARSGEQGNRFIVGDVKQSIYRFRLANPRIFQRYAQDWASDSATARTIPLTENFRSHEAILEFVNRLFAALMRREVGGVDYDRAACLEFGDRAARAPLSLGGTEGPPAAGRVELHLRVVRKAEEGIGAAAGAPAAERTNTEQEAALIAGRLRDLRRDGFPVWDAERRAFRPVEWRDMVILLRSPRNKAEAFAKVFDRAAIPLAAVRSGLYGAVEVSDLLSLLWLLDNPLQDIPVLAVLRSPLVGLTLDELALIRLEQRSGEFWTALQRFRGRGPASASDPHCATGTVAARATLWTRVDAFLARYERWRTLARRSSLSHCLETVLDETRYEDWIEAQPRGLQRRANVQRLLTLTRQFDQFQRQGLFRFLKFVEAQQAVEYDPEPAATDAENAVRLMSIHQSKGLEFPIVALADLAKPFNLDDTRGAVLLDEQFGLCPMVKPAGLDPTYPSLPHWLAARRQQREVLGEEIRLLYVAATRACDKLILVGTANASRVGGGWQNATPGRLAARPIVEARSCLDWIGRLMPELTGDAGWATASHGTNGTMQWHVHEAAPPDPTVVELPEGVATEPPCDPAVRAELQRRLSWEYRHSAATRESAKTSVTTLRRRVTEETDGESRPLFPGDLLAGWSHAGRAHGGDRELTAAERGTAHHRFLEFAVPDRLAEAGGAEREAERLEHAGVLLPAEVRGLDLAAVQAFWRSELGERIRRNAPHIRSEMEFTLRISPDELRALAVPVTPGLDAGESIVVQGVVDLAVVRPNEVWIVDFKTDHVSAEDSAAKGALYSPQLRLYALALARIYARPVTEAWLHFLTPRKSVAVAVTGSEAAWLAASPAFRLSPAPPAPSL